MRIRPIKTERDHGAALERVEALWDSPANSEEAEMLEVLSTLVEVYEEKNSPIPAPDPIDAILFRLEQTGQDRADLQRLLGVGRGRVSEILNRKRSLSLAMIRKLVDSLRIPAEVLIQSTKQGA